ncbi:hypothetical protein ACLX1H_003467 [Fusarium chlamydosporum]
MPFVGPHFFRAIVRSNAPKHIREKAQRDLDITESVMRHRASFDRARETEVKVKRKPQQIVPPHILRNVAESNQASEDTRAKARESLDHLESVISKARGSQRTLEAADHKDPEPAPKDPQNPDHKSPKGPYRAVYDAHESPDEGKLPGRLILDNKEEHQSKDKAVNLAFENVGTVLDFYKRH